MQSDNYCPDKYYSFVPYPKAKFGDKVPEVTA